MASLNGMMNSRRTRMVVEEQVDALSVSVSVVPNTPCVLAVPDSVG